jgi:phosphoacetylglucosamine mutase
MLEASWEKYATQLANADSDDSLVHIYNDLAKTLKVNLDAPAKVIFARDTRASGSRLVECLNDALTATAAEITDYKILTTPQLHYLVRCVNTKGTQDEYGHVSEKGYYEKLAAAFKQAMEHTRPQGSLTVDCANGVGGPKLRELLKYLSAAVDGGIDIKVINDDVHKPETLNHQVSR